ncbi:MAG TPA: HD-GYP domain-containing protein [Thermomicrobiales bacterium]|nr:HD-GYP domain-containing protein [Thermomicrobiales bacterium]
MAAAALVVVSVAVVPIELTRTIIITAIVLGLISMILELIDFPLLIGGETSFSTVAYMAMVFLLPFPLAAIVGLAVVVCADLRVRKAPAFLIFNASNYTLTLGLSSLLWYLAYGTRQLHELPMSVVPLLMVLVVIAVFYVVNVFLMNGIIGIISRRSVKYIWLTNDINLLLPYICLEVVGVLVALVWLTAAPLTPLLIIPAVTTYVAFEMIQRLQHQTQEAMLVMADAIDQRDPYTADHSRRVSDIALRVAEVYGVNERDLERLRMASRLHDIGKIGIGNDLLHKPGKLTDAEWKIMQDHPVIGEQLLKPYRQFKHETALVRSHHERWDGKGYPDKLRGQQIPLGARIIAVADTFDAMTTARPYRGPLSKQVAIEEIRNNAMTQFDPKVVASFLQVMEEWSKVLPISGDDRVDVSELGQAPAWFYSAP